MNHDGTFLARLDRLLVGLVWGSRGLDRGVTVLRRLTAADAAAAGLAAAALCVQALVLPHPGPWPVKLLGSLNLLALVAGVACYRAGWRGALRGVLVSVAVVTLAVALAVTAIVAAIM